MRRYGRTDYRMSNKILMDFTDIHWLKINERIEYKLLSLSPSPLSQRIYHSLSLLLQTQSKFISFINPFLHTVLGSYWTAFTNLEPVYTGLSGPVLHLLYSFFFLFFLFLESGYCARLSWWVITFSFLVHVKLFLSYRIVSSLAQPRKSSFDIPLPVPNLTC